MRITIDIDTSNAAFDDSGEELQRIMRDVADRLPLQLAPDNRTRNLYDINGNYVGQFRLSSPRRKSALT